jgi:hypothetical protein
MDTGFNPVSIFYMTVNIAIYFKVFIMLSKTPTVS